MPRAALRALLASALCAVVFCPAAGAGALRHAGRWLIDAKGRIVILHGVGVMDYSPPSLPAAVGFDGDDAAFLAAHGFNYVRVGMNWSGIEPLPGVFNGRYLSSIAQTVQTLAGAHIYSLLDWHQDDWGTAAAGIDGAPAWATETDGLPDPISTFAAGYFLDAGQQHAFDHFWSNSQGPSRVRSQGPSRVRLQAYYGGMLAKYASTFRGQPYLLGYELFNEPFPGTPWATCTNPAGCALFDAQLASFYRREIGAIRAADRTHLIFYEPNIFFDFGANTNLVNPDGGDRGTGFAFHDYCLGTGAGTAIPPIPGNGPGCALEEQLVMNDAMSYVRRTHAGLLNTEWGATSDTATITRMAAEFDSDGISWLFWSYNGPLFVRDPRKPPTGSNVNGRIVALLDRPYPRAVAGTPLGWSWDPATRRLQLRYSTSPPAGMRLVPGALTEVWAGAVHYPHGYRVRASGASVASRAQAPVLLLRTRPGAPQVTVTVSPAR